MKKLLLFLALFLPLAAFGQVQPVNANAAGSPVTLSNGAIFKLATVNAGLPTGGIAGQFLAKIDGTNYNTTWTTPGGGGNVSTDGTAVSGQVALFLNGTAIAGQTLATWTPTFKGLTLTRTDSNYQLALDSASGSYGFAVTGGNFIFTDLTHSFNLIESDGGGVLYFPQLNSNGFLMSNAGGGAVTTEAAILLGSQVSGNLAVSHLNSGTGASGSTFWAGDGTWKAGGGTPAGSDTYVQYNHSGAFGANSGFTSDTSGNVAALSLATVAITSPPSSDLSISASSGQLVQINSDEFHRNAHAAIFGSGTTTSPNGLYINYAGGIGVIQTFGANNGIEYLAQSHTFLVGSNVAGLSIFQVDGTVRVGSGTDNTVEFQVNGNIYAPLTTPANSSATGVAGTIEWDANFIYICTATNTWKRATLATF